ncbi:MAG: TonB-dependent receptor, partial [Gemmatimonas sp.]
MRQNPRRSLARRLHQLVAMALAALPAVLAAPARASAQAGGTVTGIVVHTDSRTPIQFARVEVEGTRLRAATDERGRFRLAGVPAGDRMLIVSWMSTGGQRAPITVPSGEGIDVRIEYRAVPHALSEVRVTGASRVPQWVVEAPVAIAVVDRVESRNYATTGQIPQAIKGLAGMDVSSNGIYDFNVNTRGFNSDLAQRMLVLMDGRDLAIPFLAAQEWSALSMPLDDFERIEVARGPSAALFGANAYNGVINIIGPAPRDVTGSKVSLSGGELSTIRADARHARVMGRDQQFGVRANLGFSRSNDWHLSRTNLGDLEKEYARRVDTAAFPVNTPAPGFEVLPLNGQSLAGLPGSASGAPAPVENVYGSTRLDYYHANGAVGTVEGGAARAENQLFMTNVGRFQVDHAWRPWARAVWNDPRYYVMGWYSGRSSEQHSMASGAPIEEKSSLLHVESQWNGSARNDRVKFVLGASYRRSLVDSRGTLVAVEDDARNDWSAGAFGQLKVAITPRLSLVVAGRSDGSNLYDAQFSPKAALVYSPTPEQALRLSAGRGFQTPRMTNFFLHVPLGLPADLSALEAGMRTAFGAALSNVPQGTLFTQTAAVPALALGNSSLDVEHVNSFEVGYRRELDRRVSFTVDGYYSVVRDFVSALLPYANSAYSPWTAPASVSPSAKAALEGAVHGALGAGSGLTRLNDAAGTTAIVYSYGNAGRATEWGMEFGAAFELSKRVRITGNYSYFDFTVDEGVPLVPGDLIVPNTPRHKGNVRASFTASRFDAWSSASFATAHDWSSGFFRGRIPSNQ